LGGKAAFLRHSWNLLYWMRGNEPVVDRRDMIQPRRWLLSSVAGDRGCGQQRRGGLFVRGGHQRIIQGLASGGIRFRFLCSINLVTCVLQKEGKDHVPHDGKLMRWLPVVVVLD
jgi:hypothetical protein